MSKRNFLRAFELGFVFIAVAILDKILRNRYLSPKVGEYTGHIITTVILTCFVLTLTYLFVGSLRSRKLGRRRRGTYNKYLKDLAFVGLMWLTMSVMAEVVREYFVEDPFDRVFMADYNILKGRLMGIMLLAEALSPYLLGVIILRE